jgi:hypothetical protein
MANPEYRRVVGDTESNIEDQLLADASNVDLSNFQEVELHLEKPDGTTLTDDTTGAVSVQDVSNGVVQYQFQSGDLDQTGRYRYEWEVTFGDGGVLTFPGDELATIYVRDELA